VSKARDLIAPVLGSETGSRLIEAMLALEDVTDLRTLRHLLQTSAPRSIQPRPVQP
jgi:hypothetical protein